MSLETLTCETCNNDWTREKKRGRKPKHCPDCSGAPSENTRYPCPVCDKDYASQTSLKAHITRSSDHVRDSGGVELIKLSVFCDHSLHITCNKMYKESRSAQECGCRCHEDKNLLKYRDAA